MGCHFTRQTHQTQNFCVNTNHPVFTVSAQHTYKLKSNIYLKLQMSYLNLQRQTYMSNIKCHISTFNIKHMSQTSNIKDISLTWNYRSQTQNMYHSLKVHVYIDNHYTLIVGENINTVQFSQNCIFLKILSNKLAQCAHMPLGWPKWCLQSPHKMVEATTSQLLHGQYHPNDTPSVRICLNKHSLFWWGKEFKTPLNWVQKNNELPNSDKWTPSGNTNCVMSLTNQNVSDNTRLVVGKI